MEVGGAMPLYGHAGSPSIKHLFWIIPEAKPSRTITRWNKNMKHSELGFGTFLVPAVSVFGTWKQFIRFRYFGTFLKRVIRYRYFGAVFRYCWKTYICKKLKGPLMPFNIFLSPYKTYSKHLNIFQSLQSIYLSISEPFAASSRKDQQ